MTHLPPASQAHCSCPGLLQLSAAALHRWNTCIQRHQNGTPLLPTSMCRPCCASALKRNARGSKPRRSPWTMGANGVVSLRDGRKAARCVELPEAATNRLYTASAQAIGGYVASWITGGRGASGVVAFAKKCRTLDAQAHQVSGHSQVRLLCYRTGCLLANDRGPKQRKYTQQLGSNCLLAHKCEGKSIITGCTLARPVCLCSSAIPMGGHPATPSV